MGECLSKWGGFDQMKEDIKSLKQKLQLLNGNMSTIEKGSEMVKAQLPKIDQAKNLIQT